MGRLSSDLRDMGFEPTGEESPIHEDGVLWSNGHEIVCDETGTVIDGNHYGDDGDGRTTVYTYHKSENVKLVGGHVSSYDWGEEENGFRY